MTLLTYVVKYGDWLAKIAEDHGSTVAAIWSHPGNAAHRAKRGSPDVLYPGDVLQIPVAAPLSPPAPIEPPPAIPPATAPTVAGPVPELPWPYSDYEGPFSTKPTWECPGGTCQCHPVPEDEPLEEHVIVCFDPQGVRMPGARCRVVEAGRVITPDPTMTDSAGELRVELRASTSSVRVEWAPSNLPPHDFLPYRKIYHVKMGDDAGDVGLERRLANLGFARGRRLDDNVRDYQRAYGREPTGRASDIRLEVLERHDSGGVGVFQPHPAQEGSPVQGMSQRSLFASPQPRHREDAPKLGFAPDADSDAGPGPSAGSGAGGKTETGQNTKGSTVPDASNMLLAVALEGDFPILDPRQIQLKVRALNVPGMTDKQRGEDVKPTVDGTPVPKGTMDGIGWPDHLMYGFKDIPTGRYKISVFAQSVANASGQGTTWALGYTEVELKMGLLTTAYVGMKRSHPVHNIDDPILDVDCPPMQMRRKMLATLYNLLPMSQDFKAAEKGIHPPYGQGSYKPMYLGGVVIVNGKPKGENTCAAMNGCGIQKSGASGFGKDMKEHPSFVRYAPGTAPSIGDTAYYGTDAEFKHMGIVVHSDPESGNYWVGADGGQPDRTSEFKKSTTGVWGRFYNEPDYTKEDSRESAWFTPRWFHIKTPKNKSPTPYVVNAWTRPVLDTETFGYQVVGWSDLTHSSRPFLRSAYDKQNSEAAYRACKARIRNVLAAALADRAVCQAFADAKDGGAKTQ